MPASSMVEPRRASALPWNRTLPRIFDSFDFNSSAEDQALRSSFSMSAPVCCTNLSTPKTLARVADERLPGSVTLTEHGGEAISCCVAGSQARLTTAEEARDRKSGVEGK